MKTVYPAIFTDTGDGFLIEVPDLDIVTQGTDFKNAVDMANDAISLTIVCLEDDLKKDAPLPSPAECIDASKGKFAKDGKSFVSLVDIDTEEYRKILRNFEHFENDFT